MKHCCQMAVKIRLTPSIIDNDIPQSIIADFVYSWDKSPEGRTILTFKFCPWCGAPWKPDGAIWERPEDKEGEEWKG